jgi:hypothetical protein
LGERAAKCHEQSQNKAAHRNLPTEGTLPSMPEESDKTIRSGTGPDAML